MRKRFALASHSTPSKHQLPNSSPPVGAFDKACRLGFVLPRQCAFKGRGDRIGGFTPGSSRNVTLYFVEHYWTGPGKRVFNVIINGQEVLTDFDIFADAGGQYIAVAHTFTTTANVNDQVVVQFVSGVDSPMVNGIVVN
jgi:Malectin domain